MCIYISYKKNDNEKKERYQDKENFIVKFVSQKKVVSEMILFASSSMDYR